MDRVPDVSGFAPTQLHATHAAVAEVRVRPRSTISAVVRYANYIPVKSPPHRPANEKGLAAVLAAHR